MSTADKKEFLGAYHKIHESLVRFCIVKSRGIMDPKDLVHDVLLVGLENYSKLKNKQALLSFLFTTANNICLNKLRRKKFAGTYHQSQADNLHDHSAGIEEKVDLKILYAALEELPELQKEALVLFEISDLPIKEIMEIQESKESAVKQRIKRGREKLVALLREDYAKETALVAALLFHIKGSATQNIDLYFAAAQNQTLPISLLDATEIIQNFGLSGSAALSKGIITSSQKLIVATASFIVICGAVLFVTNKEKANSRTPIETTYVTPIIDKVEKGETTEKQKLKATPTLSKRTNKINVAKLNSAPQTLPSNIFAQGLPNQIEPLILPSDTIKEESKSTVLTIDDDRIQATDIQKIIINNLGEKVTINTWAKEEVLIESDFVYSGKKTEDDQILAEKIGHIVNLKDGDLSINSTFDVNCSNFISLGKKRYNTVTFSDGQTAKFKDLERSYQIYLPARLAVELVAKNAEINIGELSSDFEGNLHQSSLNVGNIAGNLNLISKYSKVNIGDFKNAKLSFMQTTFNFANGSDIDLDTKYSKINGVSIHNLTTTSMQTTFNFQSINGDIDGDFKYSNLTANTSGEMNATSMQTNFYLTHLKSLTGTHKYSKIESQNIDNVDLKSMMQTSFKANEIGRININSSKYSSYTIQRVNERIEITSMQDQIKIHAMSPNVKSIAFSGKYSNYDLTLNSDAQYDLDYTGKYSKIDYNKANFLARTIQNENQTNIIQGLLNQSGTTQANLSMNCFQGIIALK